MDDLGSRCAGGMAAPAEGGVFMALLKKHRQLALYCGFGMLTFVVSVATYALCERALGLNELIANPIAWVFAVLFAFATNRRWVFDGATAQNPGGLLRQVLSFFGGRLFTLGVEELMLLVFVTWKGYDGVLIKVLAQVVVVTLNYFISKFLVFRKPSEG